VEKPPDSVLHIVAAAGDDKRHLKCARMIYEKTPVAAINSNGDTPLHYAARAKNTKMVACLIELAKGGGVNGVDSDSARDLVRLQNYKRGETVLFEAIRFGNTNIVKNLLSTDKMLAQIDANDGTSPLYLACSLGHVYIVELMLQDKDMKPTYSGPRGQNALHAAVLRNKKGEVLRKLPIYLHVLFYFLVLHSKILSLGK
jgi:ankyrin repeat protein